jgi:FkbM family methyltransferase
MMFQFQGIWFPDGEKHFPEWMEKNGELVDGKGTYQIKKFRAAMEHVRNFRKAVDVGAHVGLWSMQLQKTFQSVHAFEPVSAFRDCFGLNVSGVVLYGCALGAEAGEVRMSIDPADTGGTHIGEEGPIVRVLALDAFNFSEVDFLKIDCEGYEHHVIDGARETLRRCKPCVIVEQKPHKLGPNFGIKGTPAVDRLKHLGYKVVREIGGDYIMTAE